MYPEIVFNSNMLLISISYAEHYVSAWLYVRLLDLIISQRSKMKFSSTLYNFCILSDSLEPFPLKTSKTVSPRMLPHVDIHYLDLIALKCVIRRFGSLIKLHRHNKRVVFKLVLINARRCNKAGFSWTQYNLITSIICSVPVGALYQNIVAETRKHDWDVNI